MAFYLQRSIFEEFDRDAMIRRFRSDSRVFCILDEQEYNYFASRGDLNLHILCRRPRLLIRLRFMIDADGRSNREMILVSNRRVGVLSEQGD
jgi:hypothetical protein